MNLGGILIQDKYQIIKEIGRGSMSVVYLGKDIHTNSDVAIKILKNKKTSNRVEDVIRFHSEAAAISRIKHPNIVKILDVGNIPLMYIPTIHYIVMEKIEGITLQAMMADQKIIPLETAIEIVIQICYALEEIHNQGIIHRDIKPSNIMIDGTGTVKLIDFGLIRIKELSELKTIDEIIGTFAYMDPAQSGIIMRNVDERIDIYSLGIILYQMLTGSLPYTGDSIISLINQHIASIPPSPRQLNIEIPLIIENIILKLIEKEPEKRYQTPCSLRNDLELFKNGKKNFILDMNNKNIQLNYYTQLFGRNNELVYLEKQYQKMTNGKGSLCLISGEAGIGKTRLAQELANKNTSQNCCFLTSKAYAGESMTPYAPLQEAINLYIKLFSQYNKEKKIGIQEQLHKELHEHANIILNFNPSLRLIIGDYPPLVKINPVRENMLFHTTLSRFLLNLSLAETGMVLVINDMQWLDEGSFEILSELIKNIEKYPLLIIGTYRHNEINDTHSLRTLIKNSHEYYYPLHSIHLHPLMHEEIIDFISALLHEESTNIREISSLVYSKSSGNPFFSIEILKKLINEKAFTFEKGNWLINRDIINTVQISPSLIDVILNRLSLLTPNEKNILSYAAVIGRKFDQDILLSLKRNPLSDKNHNNPERQNIRAVIKKAISLNLLESDIHNDQLFYFTHDRIREAFYLAIKKKKKKDLHFCIASFLEKRDNPEDRNIFDIANHFIESGNTKKILKYAYCAGTKAMEAYANDNALRYFNITIRILEKMNLLSNDNYHNLWLLSIQAKGEIFLIIGKYDEAIKLFNKIMPRIKNNTEKALLYKQICKAYLKKGDWYNTEKYGHLGLQLLGEKLPLSRSKVNIAIGTEFLKLILIKIIPFEISAYKRTRFENTFKHTISLYMALAWSYGLSNTRKLTYVGLRFYNILYQKKKNTIEDAIAMGGFGMLLNVLHQFRLARKHLLKRLTLSTELNDEWGIAQAHQQLGFCYQWSGNFIISLESFRKSIILFKKIGDIRESAISTLGLFENYYYISDYENLISEIKKYHNAAIKSGDNYAISSALHYKMLYYLEKGDLDQSEKIAFSYNNFSHNEGIQYRYYLSKVELGRLFMEKGEMNKAYQFLIDAITLRQNNNFIGHYIIQHDIFLSEVCIALYIENKLTPIKKKKILRLIRQHSIYALKQSQRWIAHRGAALRVRAKYYAIKNKNNKAEKFFQMGINHSESIGKRYELAQCYYDYALFLKNTQTLAEATPVLIKAHSIFNKIGAQHKIKTIEKILNITQSIPEPIYHIIEEERSSSFLETWSTIMNCSDFDSALHIILSRAINFSGAKRGYIFIYNEQTDSLELLVSLNTSGLYSAEYSANIVQKAFSTGEIIVTPNAESEIEFNEFSSVTNFSLKSIICIPIKFYDKVSGACYIDNPLAKNIFTDRDIEFLKTFINQASLLLQNKFIKTIDIPSNNKTTLTDTTMLKLEQIKQYIHDNYKSNISREALAYSVDMSPNYISKLFKKYTGNKISKYINELRIKDAAQKLLETDINIIDIAYSAGFESLRTFNRAFLSTMGDTPTRYRKINSKEKQ